MTIIDLPVADALARLMGIRAFIEHLDESIPAMESRARKALDELATEKGWDYFQFHAESQVLDADYRHSIPRYATYSAIFLLYSFIETQLVGCAERVGRKKGTLFQVRDLKGTPLEATSLFLQRVSALPIQNDPDWNYLEDMRSLRNIIVHRDGRRGEQPKHRKEYQRLLDKYKPELSENPVGLDPELRVSVRLCMEFLEKSERFVKGLFIALGSQHYGLQK